MIGRTALAAVLVLVMAGCGGGGGGPPATGPGDPTRGAEVYAASCLACHGPNAAGNAAGPPLVDPIYRPGHHADGAFLVAVRAGVRQHHWDFGPMPALPGVTDQDVADVTAYVRELQRAAGIE